MKVLLVDDQERSLFALEGLLSGLGLTLVKARSGEGALRSLLADDFAVILIDVMMPGMDGFELASLIRGRDRSRATPIIFLTACEQNDSQIEQAYALGAVDYLFKPIVPEILRAKVIFFVELQQKTEEIRRQEELLRENERREHERRLAEQRRTWEVEHLREEAAREKRNAEELARTIADRQRAEAALQASEERFRALVENSSDAVVVLDEHGTVTFVTNSIRRVLGYAPEEFVGKVGFDLVHPDNRDAVLAEFAHLLRNPGATIAVHTLARHKHGTWRSMEVVCTNLLGNPAIRGVVANFRDTTERKQAEEDRAELLAREQAARAEAEAASRAKDEFLAVLSHELRTPLTPVLLTVSSMLQDPETSPALRSSLEMTRQNIELEARLIDDLLDVTRIVRGKLTLHCETVDVHELIERTLQTCESDLRSAGLRLELRLDANAHHVCADPARLQQVLWNLVKNAVKFTPSGGAVTVQTQSHSATQTATSEPGESSVLIEVRDTGVGIEPDVLPKIFNAFEQGRSSRRMRQFGGLGLGLAISQSVMQAHGGRLTVHSAGAAQGSTFVVELKTVPAPRALGPDGQIQQCAPRARPVQTILLVEDDPATLRILSRLLSTLGYNVLAADSLASAQALAEDQSFDLVISDIGLPDGSGLELMRRIRSSRAVKGIALSGFGMEEDIERSREAGFIEHLTKPIDLQRLEATILRVAL
jgi:PAS domain S-box-containing protein